MNPKEYSALRSTLPDIVSLLELDSSLLDVFVAKDMLSPNEHVAYCQSTERKGDKNRNFFHLVLGRGQKAYSIFVDALVFHPLSANHELGFKLTKKCQPWTFVSNPEEFDVEDKENRCNTPATSALGDSSRQPLRRYTEATSALATRHRRMPVKVEYCALGNADGRVGEGSTGISQPARDLATAAVQSMDREANPWTHERFRETTHKLQKRLTAIQDVCSLCWSHSLIDGHAQQELELLKIPLTHNGRLLRILIAGGSRDAFGKLREIISHIGREGLGVFDDILLEWNSIGPPPEDFKEFRRKLE